MIILTRILLLSAFMASAKPVFAEQRVIAGFLGIGSPNGTKANPYPPVQAGFLGYLANGHLPPLPANPNDPGDISDITALFTAVDTNPNLSPEIKARLKQQLIRLSLERKAQALAAGALPNAAPPAAEQQRGVAGFMGVPNPPMPIPLPPEPPNGFPGGGATTAR